MASSKWNFSYLTKPKFFWIFCVKTINHTNFRHYSPILSGFWSFGTIFSSFKDFFFFILNLFWKTQCSEVVCSFVWHLNTMKVNSIIKNISNFMKFQEKKIQNFWSFYSLLTLLDHKTRPQLEFSSHLNHVILST